MKSIEWNENRAHLWPSLLASKSRKCWHFARNDHSMFNRMPPWIAPDASRRWWAFADVRRVHRRCNLQVHTGCQQEGTSGMASNFAGTSFQFGTSKNSVLDSWRSSGWLYGLTEERTFRCSLDGPSGSTGHRCHTIVWGLWKRHGVDWVSLRPLTLCNPLPVSMAPLSLPIYCLSLWTVFVLSCVCRSPELRLLIKLVCWFMHTN